MKKHTKSTSKAFEVVELYHHLRFKNYKVSMATIYNNMKLYKEAGLVTRHRFGNGTTQYEKCYFRGDHHIIFTDTGEVKEFKDSRIEDIQRMIEDTYGIVVDRYSLYFYGRRCPNKQKFEREETVLFEPSSKTS